MSFAVSQYRVARLETASPLQVVVQLYDGAVRFMRQGAAFIEAKDPAGKGVALRKAHAIVSELQLCLDPTKAPELGEQLDRLYEFVLYRITDANAKNDASGLEAAINVMLELRGAWAEVATTDQST